MLTKKALTAEITSLDALAALTRAYAEISSLRMHKTRGRVVSARDFLDAIDKIFQEVRASHRRKVKALAKRRRSGKGERLTFLAHNGKTVVVFLSANTGLYGDLMMKTFRKFMEEVEGGGVEVTIIGKFGRSLFLGSNANRPHTFFELSDTQMNQDQLAAIIRHLVQYEQIRIYYGKFNNVVSQTAEMFNISAENPIVEKRTVEEEGEITKFLFEPTLEKILMFFETEMFGSMFEQTVREGQLAKFASRMLAMDKAGLEVARKLKKSRVEKMRVEHRLANRKQLNSLSGIMMRR